MAETKYYKAIISSNCSLKFHLQNSEDANKLVREWVADQNKGEAKSDRLMVIQVRNITSKEYNSCNWPERSFYLL